MGWRYEPSDRCDVWIHHEDSMLIAVKSYEITECGTTKFFAGFTIRFPRVDKTRRAEKACATIDDIKFQGGEDQRFSPWSERTRSQGTRVPFWTTEVRQFEK